MKPPDIIWIYSAIIRGILNYNYHVENNKQFSYILLIFKLSAVCTLAIKWNIIPKIVIIKVGNPLSVEFQGKKGK